MFIYGMGIQTVKFLANDRVWLDDIKHVNCGQSDAFKPNNQILAVNFPAYS